MLRKVDWKQINISTMQNLKGFLMENSGPYQVMFCGSTGEAPFIQNNVGYISAVVDSVYIDDSEVVMIAPNGEMRFKKRFLFAIDLNTVDFQHYTMLYDGAVLDLGPEDRFSWIITLCPRENPETSRDRILWWGE